MENRIVKKHLTWMNIALDIANLSTCAKRPVGAVTVLNDRLLTTGFNGSPKGFDHCTENGCILENGKCISSVHAEVNAVIQGALHGLSLEGSTMYCTLEPCLNCTKVIINAGIKRVVFLEAHPKNGMWPSIFFESCGVEYISLENLYEQENKSSV